MYHEEIAQLLRELMTSVKAEKVQISALGMAASPLILLAPLGQGMCLYLHFAKRPHNTAQDDRHLLAQNIELSARALRSCQQSNHYKPWPQISVPRQSLNSKQLIHQRIEEFLRALTDNSNLYQFILTYKDKLIASAYELRKLDSDRLPLLNKQLNKASSDNPLSSHAELVREDLYAMSFWFGASLFGFSDVPYAEDFVRFRSKKVSKELEHLLALLEDEPDTPAHIAPLPPQ